MSTETILACKLKKNYKLLSNQSNNKSYSALNFFFTMTS